MFLNWQLNGNFTCSLGRWTQVCLYWPVQRIHKFLEGKVTGTPCCHKLHRFCHRNTEAVMKTTPEPLSAVLRNTLGVGCLTVCVHYTVYIYCTQCTVHIVHHSADRALSFMFLLSRTKVGTINGYFPFYNVPYSLGQTLTWFLSVHTPSHFYS